MSDIEDRVIAKIEERAEAGFKKYGTTMIRDDLSFQEWLTHLQEELMDACVYVERIMLLSDNSPHTMGFIARMHQLEKQLAGGIGTDEEIHLVSKRSGEKE
jgi:hypothetical protein